MYNMYLAEMNNIICVFAFIISCILTMLSVVLWVWLTLSLIDGDEDKGRINKTKRYAITITIVLFAHIAIAYFSDHGKPNYEKKSVEYQELSEYYNKTDRIVMKIDAERLKSEIERMQNRFNLMANNAISNSNMENFYDGEKDCCRQILLLIDSLQKKQKDVELQKEIDACWQNWISPSNQKTVECVLPKTEFAFYARHFYEFGRKGGSK